MEAVGDLVAVDPAYTSQTCAACGVRDRAKQQWIAQQAREHPDRVFTSLHHLIDLDWMFEAWALTRKDGAAGIDGRTAGDYEMDLEANLESLLSRIKSGSFRAPPVRRHYILRLKIGKTALYIALRDASKASLAADGERPMESADMGVTR